MLQIHPTVIDIQSILLFIQKINLMVEVKSNLFALMEMGDRKIDKIKKKVIMIVGNIRSGKSCLYNWILGNQMVGEDSGKGVKYINVKNNKLSAQIGQDITPTTLIPNCFNIDSQTTLLEMAGYNKASKYIQVIGASYFLKGVVEQAQEFKFLIVIGEQIFLDTTGRSIVQTLQGFLSMFNFTALTSEIKNQLFLSISVVITRAKQQKKHIAYLNLILQRIRDPKFKVQNRELMMELVEHMINDKRVECFELAKLNNSPEKCNISNRCNDMGWQFMKIKQINSQIKQSITSISLQYEFNRLPNEEKDIFYKIMYQRIKQFTDFNYTLKILKRTFKQNWINLVQSSFKEALSGDSLNQLFRFSDVFYSIQTYLKNNDKYNLEVQGGQGSSKQYHSSLMQIINSILKIYEISAKITSQYLTSFQQLSKKYSEFYSQLSDNFKPFCRNVLQQQMATRLKFIFARGFRQFSSLYQIYPSRISAVNQDMKDRCASNIFEQSSCTYIQTFIKFMPINIFSHLFTTISEIDKYQQLFNHYKEKLQLRSDPQDDVDERNRKQIQLKGYIININSVKADIYLKQGDKIRACNMYIEILRLLCAQQCLIFKLYNDANKTKLNDLYLMKLTMVQRVVNILATLNIKKYPTAKKLAIRLCQHFNEIDAVCQLYDSLLLHSNRDKTQLCTIYQKYADYCIEWGRYSEAKVLLQKKLRLQNYNFEERNSTINAIYNLIENENSLREAEKQRFVRLSCRQQQQNSEVLEELFGEIKILIAQGSEQKVSDQKQKVIYQKKPCRREEKDLLQAYKNFYLEEETDTQKRLIEKIEHIKLELALPDYEHFFNNTRTAIKQSLQKEILSLSKYEQSLKLPSDLKTEQFNELTKQQFVQIFGKPYLSLFYRTSKVKIRTVKELVFMHGQNTNEKAIDQLENRVSEGVEQLQRMVEQLQDSFVRTWKNSNFDKCYK